MVREYQHGYSDLHPGSTYDDGNRKRKAETMTRVLGDYYGADTLGALSVLDVGASTGFIDEYLSHYFDSVAGIDIDDNAINHAVRAFKRENLSFAVGDAMALDYQENFFDIVICSHVYEHVPDADVMMSEIFRVLKPGGICYLSAGNRINIIEPHHKLPFLSVIPKPLAHIYMRLAGRGGHYYETHRSYWGLRKMVENFSVNDYTAKLVKCPDKFGTAYMIPEGSRKQRFAIKMLEYAYWLMPGYIWLLKKPRL